MTAAAHIRQPNPVSGLSGPDRQADNHVARFRPNELHRLRQERYGSQVITQDDDGHTLISATLDCLALSAEPDQRMTNFLILHCPWMSSADRADAKQRATGERRFWSPAALGDALKLTPEERQKLRITTFRAAGVGDEEMAALRRAKETARKQAKRHQERLHPPAAPKKPTLRLEAILTILRKPGEWVSVKAICMELTRMRVIHFATLRGPNLTTAVHDAVRLGLESGVIEKRFVEGAKRFKVAEICLSGRCKP